VRLLIRADFEKFVEVGTHNRKELQALQQRICGVESLIKHTLVEFQPAQLTVDEMFAFREVHKDKISAVGRLDHAVNGTPAERARSLL
jgi:Holliday junction resolvasome RuvABC endonuclease subunit